MYSSLMKANNGKNTKIPLELREKFPHSPYFLMHAHLISDTLNNKAPFYVCIMTYGAARKFCQNEALF